MWVWRIASASALGSVVFARLNASAATRIASKVKATLSAWPTSRSFGNFYLNAAATFCESSALGLNQGTTLNG